MLMDILIGAFLLTASIGVAVVAWDIVMTERESREYDREIAELDRELLNWLKAQHKEEGNGEE